jgi:hypothetical protein
MHDMHDVCLQALAGGSRITTLNLSGNNIGDAGAKSLAEMLKVGNMPAGLLCITAAVNCCRLLLSVGAST